jgi:DNA-binding transcriptional ArsR family regulator
MALRHGELCLCQLIELLGLAPSTVSKHMSVLVQAGLAEVRKDGRWHFYRLPSGSDQPQVQLALKWCNASLRTAEEVLSDDQRIEVIRTMDLQELCRRYKNRAAQPTPRVGEIDTRPAATSHRAALGVFNNAPHMWQKTG